MVIHAFPAAKLGALLLKQISKPIANVVKQQAKNSPFFKKYVCLPPAQFYNWCEVKGKMWLLHLGQPVNITVLNEAASIDLGANLLGEALIFLIAAGIVVSEYNRSSRKETAKEENRKAEIQALQNSLRDLFIQTEEQGAHIRELTRKIVELENKPIHKPKNPETNPDSRKPPPDKSSTNSNKSRDELLLEEQIRTNVNLVEKNRHEPRKGIILQALKYVENIFISDGDRKRESGVVSEGLNLLFKDVFKSHMTF